MTDPKPNLFIINISPDNWEECLHDHIFGLRKGTRHPRFSKGDIFLVRRTGKDYGVMGIWAFLREEHVADQTTVPWVDAEYSWELYFEPLVDFQTPVSEKFAGVSKFSQKLQIPAMRIAGSVIQLSNSEAKRYLESILSEKAKECSAEVDYQGEKKELADILREIIRSYEGKAEAKVSQPKRKERGTSCGEPINFRRMVYAPLNEAGVVLLFSKVMDDLGIFYESSPSSGFDMVGRIQTDKGFELKHFEFEYRSSNFKIHGHDPSMVDFIVCWEHDWPDCPEEIKVYELRELIRDLPAEFPRRQETS